MQAGLLAEASTGHRAGLLVSLLQAGEVLSAVFVVVVTPEVSMAVAATEALTEEVLVVAMEVVASEALTEEVLVVAMEVVEEATGRLRE